MQNPVLPIDLDAEINQRVVSAISPPIGHNECYSGFGCHTEMFHSIDIKDIVLNASIYRVERFEGLPSATRVTSYNINLCGSNIGYQRDLTISKAPNTVVRNMSSSVFTSSTVITSQLGLEYSELGLNGSLTSQLNEKSVLTIERETTITQTDEFSETFTIGIPGRTQFILEDITQITPLQFYYEGVVTFDGRYETYWSVEGGGTTDHSGYRAISELLDQSQRQFPFSGVINAVIEENRGVTQTTPECPS